MELPEPQKHPRRYLGGPRLEAFEVCLQSTTPILGGATAPRQVDTVDIIRVPTIRGHLRFWWRALYAHECASPKELADRERALWGGVGGEETRSQVEVSVEVDCDSAQREGALNDQSTAYYALWPARAPKNTDKPEAERWCQGLCFQLRLRVPAEHRREVENAVRAWVLWGGYGGRTRRGVGSLTVTREAAFWLPSSARGDDLRNVFGGIPLLGHAPPGGARDVPMLQGACLLYGCREQSQSEQAWHQALGWLRDFRQKEAPAPNREPVSPYAREKGEGEQKRPERSKGEREQKRPGRSNWPEADKIRQLFKPSSKSGQWAHLPRAEYAGAAAWPRVGFGLPIPIQFQRYKRTRTGAPRQKYEDGEPPDVELRWHDGTQVRKRLASSLIVKAMPLANGSFVPIALWLHRAWPEGKAVLVRGEVPVPRCLAPFEPLLAPGDKPLYAPLKASTLREAFFGWLKSHHREVKES